jgi:hypothetical protein
VAVGAYVGDADRSVLKGAAEALFALAQRVLRSSSV